MKPNTISLFILLSLCGGAFAVTDDIKPEEGFVGTYERWPNGNFKEVRIFDSETGLYTKSYYREDGVIQRMERYNHEKKVVEESLYDGGGKLADGVDGWAARRFRYDEDGILRQEVTYGSDGKPILKKHYSESGSLIARQFIDYNDIDPDEMLFREQYAGKQAVIIYTPDGRIKRAAGVDR